MAATFYRRQRVARKTPERPRFTEADRIAHTLIVLVAAAAALAMLFGRGGSL